MPSRYYDNGPYAQGSSEQTLNDEAKKLQQDDAIRPAVRLGRRSGPGDRRRRAKTTRGRVPGTSIKIHAPLEPMKRSAYEQGGVWHVHTGNQFACRTGGIAAGALRASIPRNVRAAPVLHGRRLRPAGSTPDMVIPAVLASKAVGKPVKLIYAREDDMVMDFTPARSPTRRSRRHRCRRRSWSPAA
jgi:isoquinoline 1-oxidoreductase